ncbi:MAG: hypothetical protein ABW003_06625 [Microvirga sp.]
MLLYQGADPAKQGVFFWAVSSTEESTNLDVLNLAVRRFVADEKATGRLPDQIPPVTGGAVI